MKSETAVMIGSLFNLGFAVFHIFFWKLFHWRKDLASLTVINRGVMQILNLCLTFAFLIFAYISAFHTAEMTSTALGRALLALIAVFWLLRAIEQIIFFGLARARSLGFFAVFLAGALLYGFAWTSA